MVLVVAAVDRSVLRDDLSRRCSQPLPRGSPVLRPLPRVDQPATTAAAFTADTRRSVVRHSGP